MNHWYAMRTMKEQESEAAALMRRVLPPHLWKQCRILHKQKLFRTEGRFLLNREKMFPGYLFVETDTPEELREELEKARKFPKLIGSRKMDIVPVADRELRFLQSICGPELQHDMGISQVQVDGEGNIVGAKGVLKPYISQITRKRLRKRYVLASVELFHREETILFGIILPGDRVAGGAGST